MVTRHYCDACTILVARKDLVRITVKVEPASILGKFEPKEYANDYCKECADKTRSRILATIREAVT